MRKGFVGQLSGESRENWHSTKSKKLAGIGQGDAATLPHQERRKPKSRSGKQQSRRFIIKSFTSMPTVTFWDQSDKGGMSTAVNAETSVELSASSNLSYDSLQTGSQSWLVAWNQPNFSGDRLVVQPNTYLSDLNHVPRTGGGDWKDQITSYQLYNYNPG
jgi:hypothetical protein